MERLQKIVEANANGMQIDLKDIIKQCEVTGVFHDKLTTCSKTATFAKCVSVKIRNVLNKHIAGDSSTIDKNSNNNANTDTDTNTTGGIDANAGN